VKNHRDNFTFYLTGEGRGVHGALVGRAESKRPLGRHRRRWEDNIKMDLRETGIDGANWIRLAQDMVQCKHGTEPPGSVKKAGCRLTG
jgi:hypothetical protein